MIKIYTDGGYSMDRGVGAYALVIIRNEENIFEKFGPYRQSTNNKMELKAVYEAFICAQDNPLQIFEIVSDSQYVIKSLTEWMPNWIKNDWCTSTGKPVLNKEIWQMIYPLYQSLKNINLVWVKGHGTDKWNNYVDELCTSCMNSIQD
jgi:ribonuclease HI